MVEILTVGREILDGRVIDTNASYLGEALSTRGIIPRFAQRVDDQIDRVVQSFGIAAGRASLVLVTGGLGPTSDDLTAEAFAKFAGLEVKENPEALAQIEATFRRMARPMSDVQRKQARLPVGAGLLPNAHGTAPGFFATVGPTRWFFMPGVPNEMKPMFENFVLPQLEIRPTYRSEVFATQFTSEGDLQSKLSSIEHDLPSDFEITYRTRFPENHIGLHADCTDAFRGRCFDELSRRIQAALGDDVFSVGKLYGEFKSLEQIVTAQLESKNFKIVTAESCTGGLVASRITDVAGASKVFWGSWIVYDNAAKIALGVPRATLEKYGAVSAEVATALAEAGLARLPEAGICVATTGIAGPAGGTEAKPVGLCFVALAVGGKATQVSEVRGRPGLNRGANKVLFSQKALDLVRRHLLA